MPVEQQRRHPRMRDFQYKHHISQRETGRLVILYHHIALALPRLLQHFDVT